MQTQLKVVDRKHANKIKTGDRHSLTVVGYKARGLKVGDDLHIIFKSWRDSGGLCSNCLLADECREQQDKKRCSNYTNILGNTTITKIEVIDLLHSEPFERDIWAADEGFVDFQHADDWYMTNYGEEWCFKPVTVVTWDKGPVAKKWKGDK